MKTSIKTFMNPIMYYSLVVLGGSALFVAGTIILAVELG